MADSKIKDLTPKGTVAATDEAIINDVAGGDLDKKITAAGIKAFTLTGLTASDVTDFDTEVTNNVSVVANTAKVTNATHTGDVTGSVALTIAAKAVDIAMLADGTDGELITWDNTGIATTVAAGTNGQVLTSNGAGSEPTFQAATGGFDTAGTGLTSSGSTVNAIGTASRISVSADAIDIDSGYVGQASLTTLGTITTGVWTGTDIAVANGGTGASTAQAAIDTLSAVSAATNEHVLTKDTGTGNAIWKVSSSGFSDPMTTRGDIIYKNAGGTTTRLAAGGAGEVLLSDGTDIAWGAAGAADNLGDHTATEIIKSVTFGLQGEEAGHTIIGTTASAAWTYTAPAGDTHDFVITGTGTVGQFAAAGLDVTGNITVSGTVDGIDIATDVAANTSKVTNATHSGEVTGSGALTIANNAVTTVKILDANVTLAKLANISQNTVIGRIVAGNGVPIALTDVELTAMLNVFTTSLQGVVPASGGSGTDFLSADGTWKGAGAADNLGDHTATEIIKSVTFGLQGQEAGHTIIGTTASGAWTYDVPTGDIHDFHVNSVSQMTISATAVDFQANTLTDITDITSITSLNGVAIGNYILTTDSSTSLADTANIAYLNTANTYGDGLKQTFNPDGTNAGINIGIVGGGEGSPLGDPSSVVNADFWYNQADATINVGVNGGTDVISTRGRTETLVGKTLTTPTIASFTNATHDHADAAGGGTIAITDTTGTLAETRGGTNQTTYTTGDILYASGANTLSKLAVGSNGEVLTLAAGVPSWAASGGGGGSGTDETIVKASDDTNTTTTLAADSELVTASLATGEYAFTAQIFLTSPGAAGFQYDFDGTATFTGSMTRTTWNAEVPALVREPSLGSSFATTGTEQTITIYGFIVVTGAGTFNFRFAQNGGPSGTTTLHKGSSLTVKSTGTGGGGGSGDMVLADVQTVTGAKTFGSAGAVGKLIVAGTTSGTTIIDATAVAGSTTVTLPAATDTLVGKATTDTLTNKTIVEDGTGNSIKITKYWELIPFDFTTDTATGDGKFYAHVPPQMDSYDLVYAHAEVITAGTTGTLKIQIHNVDNALDMLSTTAEQMLTIDTGETGSDTAATAVTINTSNDHVNTNDVIRVDIDEIHSGTAAKGLIVTLGFREP